MIRFTPCCSANMRKKFCCQLIFGYKFLLLQAHAVNQVIGIINILQGRKQFFHTQTIKINMFDTGMGQKWRIIIVPVHAPDNISSWYQVGNQSMRHIAICPGHKNPGSLRLGVGEKIFTIVIIDFLRIHTWNILWTIGLASLSIPPLLPSWMNY